MRGLGDVCDRQEHGIYGFIDRRAGTYDMMLPNSSTRTGEDIWQILSKAGKRVFGMNVPATYPPQPVNGILIGGFLSPSVEKAVYPRTVADYLQSVNYRIDSDALLARRDKRAILDDLNKTLDARMEAMFHFLDEGGRRLPSLRPDIVTNRRPQRLQLLVASSE